MLAGRHFVAVSLREAASLRFAIHTAQRRNRKGGTSHALLGAGAKHADVAIGLRVIEHGGRLLDCSNKFPDFDDAQLKRAVQVLRFVDHQHIFDESQQQQLLCGLQGNSRYERELFYQQANHGQHRREISQDAMKPLRAIMPCPPAYSHVHYAGFLVLGCFMVHVGFTI